MDLEKKERKEQAKLDKKEQKELAKSEKAALKGGKEKKPKKEKKESAFSKKNLKKIFNKKTFLGVTLAGALLLVVVYVFVYTDYTERTEELEAQNAETQKLVDELQEYADNMPMYQQEISEMKTAVEDIMAEYPADAREEDVIMLAVQLQDRNAIAYDAINMEEREPVYTVTADLVNAAEIEGLSGDLIFTQKHAVYVNTTNYDNLKTIIEQVYKSDNRIGIDNIVYVKNEDDGTLEGNINLYFYSVAGTDKEYVVPDIAAYLSGTSDLFQSDKVTAKNAGSAEDGEAAEGDGAEANGETAAQ